MAGEKLVRTANRLIPPEKFVFTKLAQSGGNNDASGDYSGGLVQFYYQPVLGESAEIARMIVHVKDTGGFDSSKYGNGITLTNGIVVRVRRAAGYNTTPTTSDEILLELTPDPVITNADWAGYCHDVTIHDFGIGDESMSVRWTFAKAGDALYLEGRTGDYLSVELEDNVSGLNAQYFTIQGYIN